MLHEPSKLHLNYFFKILDKSIKITFGLSPKAIDYQILIGGRPQQKHIKSDKLKSLIIPFVGIPQVTHQLMQNFPHIKIHNIHHNATATAEMAIALMLTASKRLVQIDKEFRKCDWESRMIPSLLLENKNVIVLGYGNIGKKISKICTAFDMQVIALRKNCPKEYKENNLTIQSITKLDALLPKTDIIIICLPETSETKGLIGESQLHSLPQNAILVNVGRAAIVEEESLYKSLKNQKIYAALDVWYNYPKEGNKKCNPSSYPLHKLDNLIMSPHRSGRCEENEFLQIKHIVRLLNIAATGKKMPNRIDLNRGY